MCAQVKKKKIILLKLWKALFYCCQLMQLLFIGQNEFYATIIVNP
jgi:hypothetical protein